MNQLDKDRLSRALDNMPLDDESLYIKAYEFGYEAGQEDYDSTADYERGGEDGYSKGHDDGVEEGGKVGYERGLEEGRAQGFDEGKASVEK